MFYSNYDSSFNWKKLPFQFDKIDKTNEKNSIYIKKLQGTNQLKYT